MASVYEVQLPGRAVNGRFDRVEDKLGVDLIMRYIVATTYDAQRHPSAEFIVEPGELGKMPFIEPKVRYKLTVKHCGHVHLPNSWHPWVSFILTPTVKFQTLEDGSRQVIDW